MKLNKDVLFGTLSGALVCAFVMIEFLLGYHSTKIGDGKWLSYFGVLIPITIIAIAIINKKNTSQGYLDLKEGMKTGIIISLITGIITTLFMLIYNNYINPEFFSTAMNYQTKLFKEAGKTPDEIAAIIDQYKANQKLSAQLISGIIGTPLMGMLPSLIITLILRKNKPTPA